MAYDTYESSVESGRPVELFEFTIGATTYRYTSAEDDVTYSAEIYYSEPIMRTSPTLTSSENGRQQMEITLPTDNEIAARYIGIVPAEQVQVRILRFHRGDSPNGVILWVGRIVSARFEKQGALCKLSIGDDEKRLVTGHTGNVLTLQIPFPTDVTGATAVVQPGCDHKITTCTSKFSNDINYGGFPLVPEKNPFNTGVD
jgi:hypothetical protein